MLVELAAANAAFAVIREAVNNGGDIMAAGQHLFSFFDNKAKIAKEASKSGSDSEAFFALEQIRANEIELRELMQWQGRAGLWDDFLKFQSEAKRKREAEARAIELAKIKRRKAFMNVFNGVLIAASVVTGFIAVAGLVWAILRRGEF